MNWHRHRLLLIADVPNWIFDRHCRTLASRLGDEFDIDITYQNRPFDEAEYELIYPLEWYMVEPGQITQSHKYVTGIRSHLLWPELDFADFVARLNHSFNRVHVVSRRLYDLFAGHLERLSYVSHGVDTGFFSPGRQPGSGPTLKLGWAGNRKSLGNKGFDDILEPLACLEDVDVELTHCGYADRLLSKEEMRSFYDDIDIYVCASADFEGNNNSLMEAASMARAIVTTDNGTVPEYLEDGVSALIVDRDLNSFAEAIRYLRDHPWRITELGAQARVAACSGWDWADRAEDYRRFFRAALAEHESSEVIA